MPHSIQGAEVTIVNKPSPYSYGVSISEMRRVEHLFVCLRSICISFSVNC